MKRVFSLVMMLVMLLAVTPLESQAQGTLSKKELKQVEKDAQKKAKEMEKDHWKVFSGALPIVRQYEEAYKLQRMKENGEKMYIVRTGAAVGQNFSVAKAQAIENAKLEIAKSLESKYTGESELGMGNQEISIEDASSISTYSQSAINTVAKQLGRVNVVVETYKELPNKSVRVEVTVSYSAAQANLIAKKAAQKNLQEKTQELRDRVRQRVDNSVDD